MKRILLISVLIAFTSMLVGNYRFGQDNHIEHLPMIMRASDANYLANDYFVNASEGYGPRYFYTQLLATLSELLPLPVIFLVLTLAANAIIVYVTYRLVLANSRSHVRATVAALLVGGTTGLALGGAAYLNTTALEPALLSLSLALYAYLSHNQKRLVPALLYGVASIMIHPQIGILACVVLLLGAWRLQLILLTVAVIIWVLPTPASLSTAELYRIVAEFRNPHHLLPSTFSPYQYATFAIFALIGMIYAIKHRVWRTPLIVGLILLTLGYVMVEVLPTRTFIALQTFRSVALIKWIGILVLSAYAPRWAIVLASFTLIGSKGDILTLLTSGVFVWLIHQKKYVYSYLFVAAIVGLIIIDRAIPIRHFAVVRPSIVLTDLVDPNILQLAELARDTTDPASIILTPPDWGRFRLLSNRAIVTDFKAVPYRETSLVGWHDRLLDIYGPVSKTGFDALQQMSTNYKQLGNQQLATLAGRYGAAYIVRWDGSKYDLLDVGSLTKIGEGTAF